MTQHDTKAALLAAQTLLESFDIQAHGILFRKPLYGINPHDCVRTLQGLVERALGSAAQEAEHLDFGLKAYPYKQDEKDIEPPKEGWSPLQVFRDKVAQRTLYVQERHKHERVEIVWKEQNQNYKANRRKYAEDVIQAIYELGYVICAAPKEDKLS